MCETCLRVQQHLPYGHPRIAQPTPQCRFARAWCCLSPLPRVTNAHFRDRSQTRARRRSHQASATECSQTGDPQASATRALRLWLHGRHSSVRLQVALLPLAPSRFALWTHPLASPSRPQIPRSNEKNPPIRQGRAESQLRPQRLARLSQESRRAAGAAQPPAPHLPSDRSHRNLQTTHPTTPRPCTQRCGRCAIRWWT